MGLTTDGKIVAGSILAIILLLIAAIIILIIKIATAGSEKKVKKEKKSKKEKKAKVEAEDDLAAVGFEYVTVENATPTQHEETAPVEPEETTEGATALEETEEASDEDKTE
jgi:FtsZ-interacting cell division protein ZipA